MAFSFRLPISLFLIAVINTVAVSAVPETEYNSLLSALRYRGYHVFANAIATTDLHYDIITGGNFTFFAPIDSILYTLDMSLSAADYTAAMRFHVVPRRFSISDLRKLPYGLTSLPTLLRDHEIRIVNPLSLPLPITVEGVGISVPDLYCDAHIAVHGLETVIDFRSVSDSMNSTSKSEILIQDHIPTDVLRESYAPSPQVEVQVVAPPPQMSIVSGIDTVASPVTVPSPDVSLAERRLQPEILSESIIQSQQSPEAKSEFVTQSLQSPKTKSESVTQSHQSLGTYFESTTQPLEQHVSVAAGSEFIPENIHHVSLAAKSTGTTVEEEFTPVDDLLVDCPVTDDDREQMNIANIRGGDHYMRELYTPARMTCAHGSVW
ncbi:hypothetical protein SSX86_009581 [Deinandra increscens subsp. villosa]|uniref:FAS1 domain-containing protein n=1 Tax=Deinandra increscens subsp. villosa TaxID=3103831 RepID=A0AAP0DDL0_9ASTR